ncbi:DUF2846 domain-containing protein [Ideonella paludis]|uniref:DUF2846 domain-containing protein n=1 Tax=Ideonella paludis TaxID=1233411 RepID=UPI0036286E20
MASRRPHVQSSFCFCVFRHCCSRFGNGLRQRQQGLCRCRCPSQAIHPKPGISQVYVYRNETLGAALSMPVTVNGKLAGATGPNSFFKFDLPAGSHTLTSQGDTSKLTLQTEAGKLYFVWQEVKMGMMSGGSKLQSVPEAQGKKGVLECSLIQQQ